MPTAPSNEPHLWALEALELLGTHLTAKCPAMKLIAKGKSTQRPVRSDWLPKTQARLVATEE